MVGKGEGRGYRVSTKASEWTAAVAVTRASPLPMSAFELKVPDGPTCATSTAGAAWVATVMSKPPSVTT